MKFSGKLKKASYLHSDYICLIYRNYVQLTFPNVISWLSSDSLPLLKTIMLLLEESWYYHIASISRCRPWKKKDKGLHSCMVKVIFLEKGRKTRKYWKAYRAKK